MISAPTLTKLAGIILGVLSLASCATKPTGLPTPLPDRETRMEKGYLVYLDGAGGGTADNNWADGVKEGLLQAGYAGAGEMYSWETGEGLKTDQEASLEYKRSKALGAARHIEKYVADYPGKPIEVLGFSAGTAIGIFALEKLAPETKVDNLVLLGASISNNYDLTEALKHVRGKLYIFTTTHDKMVGFFMKFTGTTDRKHDVDGADLHGFVLPPNANDETRKLYADKIVTIPWKEEMKKSGDRGRHFDNIKMEFIRDYVAPLLMGKTEAGLPD
ncbi:MAG: hypothetical protein ACR2RV_12590 [Verrucomicrobiales bacterium]